MLWFKCPPKIYFKRGSVDLALRELKGKRRAFIVTDRYLFNSGAVNVITNILEDIKTDYQIFFDIKPDPAKQTIYQALDIVRPYEPDVIIALGGGSPMDAAKLIWLLYEQPDINLENMPRKYMEIDDNASRIPELGQKAMMVCIPTTSGTGSEVSPSIIVKDEERNINYAVIDYALTPNMAIIDPNFVDSMPQGLTATSGMDALIHAIEAYSSKMSTNFVNSNALEAVKLVFKYLGRSHRDGKNDPEAREKMHYAATIAGMAFANSYISLCHTMAHKLGSMYNLPLGVTNALLIRQIIKYKITHDNAESKFAQRYGQIADELGLGGDNDIEKSEFLIGEIENLISELMLPRSLKYFGIKEENFNNKVDELTQNAYETFHTESNPHMPSPQDIKQIYMDAYHGVY
ncbi:iron-containing alcohol dehydrogenase [bacterium]|nr:iron-containing alcohol dehydrogenase [bacterium]